MSGSWLRRRSATRSSTRWATRRRKWSYAPFSGWPGRKLVETAQKVNAQLLVLAGRGSASMLLGTVSQYVLRKAPCPVLVVPEADQSA